MITEFETCRQNGIATLLPFSFLLLPDIYYLDVQGLQDSARFFIYLSYFYLAHIFSGVEPLRIHNKTILVVISRALGVIVWLDTC